MKNKISGKQLFFLVVQTQIGVGVLSLSYDVFSISKQDGWISVLLAGIFVQGAIFVIWALCRRFPSFPFYAFLPQILGKWAGNLLSFFYICYFIVTAALILVLFGEMINVWILPDTPTFLIILLMLITGVYICVENFRVLARFYTFVSLLLLGLFLLMTYALRDANPLYLLPVGESGFLNILKGSKEAILSLTGIEVLLVLYPYTQGRSYGKLKWVSLANLFVTLFYTYTVLVSLAYFSPQEIALVPQPVIYMLKAFEFNVITRIDLIFLSIWIVSVATSFITYLFIASKGIAYLFKKENNHAKFVPWVGASVFVIALLPNNDELKISAFNTFVSQLSLIFVLGIPVVLLLYSYLFHKKKSGVDHHE